MTRRIVIEPVTRIEGHAKISIFLDDTGKVTDAQFHVVEFRGFEKFCEGRSFREMPAITARVCGICPVSHLMSSAKAGDALLAVEVPPAGAKLRSLMNLAQIVQSHALSFFHMSAPDLLLGFESEPGQRNIVGLAQRFPDLARRGIRLRKFGQDIIEILGGKKIHNAWVVPGGVTEALTVEKRDQMLAWIPEARETALFTLADFKKRMGEFKTEVDVFGDFPSLFLGLVTKDGGLEHYDGNLRVTDANGNIVADQLDPARYQEYIGEAVETWSYLKSPYYKPLGYPDGIYRVGPLARLNLASYCGTPLADKEHAEFRKLGVGAVTSSFHFHYARLIEVLYGVERIEELLRDPMILDENVRSHAQRNRTEGVGCSEAPRGTLFHHYKVAKGGLLTYVNLIIATGQNNLAMNRTVKQIAERYVSGDRLNEGLLNRVEAGIRAYDPCLSCSTHAFGAMPLKVQLFDASGRMVDQLTRDEDVI